MVNFRRPSPTIWAENMLTSKSAASCRLKPYSIEGDDSHAAISTLSQLVAPSFKQVCCMHILYAHSLEFLYAVSVSCKQTLVSN